MKLKKLTALFSSVAVATAMLTALPTVSAGEISTTTASSCDFVYEVNQEIPAANDGQALISLGEVSDISKLESVLVDVSVAGTGQVMIAIGCSVSAELGLEENWYSDSAIVNASEFSVTYDLTEVASYIEGTDFIVQYWWGENDPAVTIKNIGLNVEGGNSKIHGYTNVKGDADASGKLDAADIAQVKAFNLVQTDAVNIKADINEDQTINSIDHLIIARMLLGLYVPKQDESAMRNISALDLVSEMKIGWNLGNTLDAYNSNQQSQTPAAAETCWGNPITTQAMIDAVKAAGFNTVRIPTTYVTHTGSGPNYTIDSAWLQRVQQVVDYAYKNKMYVILNIHHENDWLIPTNAKKDECNARIKALWTQIANYFKDYSDYLVFETLNEPRLVGSAEEWQGGTSEGRAVVNSFNQTAVDAIRATGGNNAKRFIMVTPYGANSGSNALNDFKLPADSATGRLIVSLHAYSPYNFALNTNGVSTFSDSDAQQLKSDFAAIYNRYVSKGTAVVMGECGALDKKNDTARVAWAKAYFGAAKQYGITCVLWDNNAVNTTGENFGYLNRSTLQWYCPSVIQAMVSSVS